MNMKDITSLDGATYDHGLAVATCDDGYGQVYAYSTDPYGGVAMLVRAASWEDAFYLARDESTPISDDEVPEAYGYECLDSEDGDHATWLYDTSGRDEGRLPELEEEGYAYQDNAGAGTGIVNVGHYEQLNAINGKWLKAKRITLHISAD